MTRATGDAAHRKPRATNRLSRWFGAAVPSAALRGYVMVVLIFLFSPLIIIIGASLDGSDHAFVHFPPRQLSLAWYLDIPARYLDALKFSILLGACSTVIACLLGIPAALGLVRGRLPGRELIASVFRSPLQIPVVVTGLAFLQAYYLILNAFGVTLIDTFAGILIGHVFITTPYVVGSVTAVLQNFDSRLEEAAYSLGASGPSTFFRVTLPVIMPGVYTGSIYAFINSFGDVPVSLFLGGSGYTTFPVEMFTAMQFDFNPRILAVSGLTILFSLMLTLLIQRFGGIGSEWRQGTRLSH